MRVLLGSLGAPDAYLAKALGEAGHVVETASDLAELMLAADGEDYDAVLLEAASLEDVQIPPLAAAVGRGLLVLLVDAATPAETARALRAGADASFVRPLRFMELEARLLALARLRQAQPAATQTLALDPGSRTARAGGRSLALSMREYALLDHLASRAGEAVGADQILEHVWGQGYAGPDRVRTGVARLRAKLRAAFGEDMIDTVRGHGYRLDAKMKLISSG